MSKFGQNWLRNARQKSKIAATKFSFLSFQHQTAVISLASSNCFTFVFLHWNIVCQDNLHLTAPYADWLHQWLSVCFSDDTLISGKNQLCMSQPVVLFTNTGIGEFCYTQRQGFQQDTVTQCCLMVFYVCIESHSFNHLSAVRWAHRGQPWL